MRLLPRNFATVWVIVLICTCGFLVWTTQRRIQRVAYVTSLAGQMEHMEEVEPGSPTGYANEQRELIIPERNEESFHWIAQTQQMFAQKEWRVRHVGYDNAPGGRIVTTASPYRWWLGLIGWLDSTISGRPIGLSVEEAALYADPVLQVLLLLGGSLFVAWHFGAFAAMLLALSMATLFPFAAGFLPGVPNHLGLANACALWSMLCFAAGMRTLHTGAKDRDAAAEGGQAGRWFVTAGVFGGIGLWISVSMLVPIIAGILLGGLFAALMGWRGVGGSHVEVWVKVPWRLWSLSGGATVLVAYLIEYFPGHLGAWRLEGLHPVYGLAWIGAGELLAQVESRRSGEKVIWNFAFIGRLAVAVVALGALPVAMKITESRGFLLKDLASIRLTNQPEGIVSASSWQWVVSQGMNAKTWATFLPIIAVLPAVWLMLRRATGMAIRREIAVLLGPVLVGLGFACWQLSKWSLFDSALMVLMTVAVMAQWPVGQRLGRWFWTIIVGLCAVPGIVQLLPQKEVDSSMLITIHETQELVERNLAHWLAKRAGEKGAIVYAPPSETTTLSYYGGLRGIGTFAADNREGFGTSLMIAGMNTLGESQALLEGRGVRYIVIPSWDPFFDEFAQLYLVKNLSGRKSALVNELRRMNLPPWLRPMSYQMPLISGFENQSVLVFEMVDEQSPAVSISRLAEYLIEMGELNRAGSLDEALKRFPGDLGALAARAQIQSALGNQALGTQILDSILSRLSSGADRYLPWDRRVSLAVVLARGDKIERAREQVKRCISEMDSKRVRSLSSGALYSLLVVSRAFEIGVTDPKLSKLTMDLLPVELRKQL